MIVHEASDMMNRIRFRVPPLMSLLREREVGFLALCASLLLPTNVLPCLSFSFAVEYSLNRFFLFAVTKYAIFPFVLITIHRHKMGSVFVVVESTRFIEHLLR